MADRDLFEDEVVVKGLFVDAEVLLVVVGASIKDLVDSKKGHQRESSV